LQKKLNSMLSLMVVLLVLVMVQPVFAAHEAHWDWLPQEIVDEEMNAIYFADSNNGWAVGFEGTILHTSDGGVNWVQQTSGTGDDLWTQ